MSSLYQRAGRCSGWRQLPSLRSQLEADDAAAQSCCVECNPTGLAQQVKAMSANVRTSRQRHVPDCGDARCYLHGGDSKGTQHAMLLQWVQTGMQQNRCMCNTLRSCSSNEAEFASAANAHDCLRASQGSISNKQSLVGLTSVYTVLVLNNSRGGHSASSSANIACCIMINPDYSAGYCKCAAAPALHLASLPIVCMHAGNVCVLY